jgi:hypothetical protein
MNQVQVVQLLNTLTDIKTDYGHTGTLQDLPKIVISIEQGSNFGADNHVYVQGWDFTLDLYTADKDPATEKKIKDLLNGAGVYWQRSETYYSDEAVYEIEFTFSVLGDETDPTPTPTPDPEPEDGDADGDGE